MKHIVLGGRANGLGVVRRLRHAGRGGHVVDLDPRAVCSVSNAVERFHVVEADDESIVAKLLELSAEQGAVAYCTDDRWNAFVVRNSARLHAAGIKFPFSSIHAMELVADKLHSAQALADIVDIPRTRAYDGLDAGVDEIVKPRFPFEGFRIRKKGANARDVSIALAQGESFVAQERIVSPLREHFSLCGVRGSKIVGALTFAKVLEYPHPGGTSTLSVVDTDAEVHGELMQLSDRLLAYLDYSGIFEIEFIRCAERARYYMIDINLRFWLQHELGALLGVDYVRLYADLVTGGEMEQPTVRRGRVAWVHEGFPLSLASDWPSLPAAIKALVTRRWLMAHFRLTDPRPALRLLGV
ncbi:hypothetical protein A7A76_19275 [Lysobacter enzymogenes]|uniref:hypothetical protein n=1 Tax=Lysobacter enzymogenes TaxID=69 RepID=UPI0019D022E3|nr:hypothetical protein [Lysobacter enzymogenes]MBN7136885.1 hypothetical protein [Lysobacter enzymogenes]